MHTKKKGISTVIAAVFMVAVIIVGINVISWGLNLQNNFGQVIVDKNTLKSEQTKENIALNEVKIDKSKFNMTVVNTGSLPVNLVSMWVTNNSAPNGWHKNYTLNNVYINPRDTVKNIGQSLNLFSITNKTYTIKLVTARGNYQTYKISSSSDVKLNVQLFVSPTTIQSGQQVSILMMANQNSTLADATTNLVPNLSVSPTSGATLISGPTPTSVSSLKQGSLVFFKWVYKLEGDPNAKFTFTGLINGGRSNSDSVSATLTQTTVNEASFAALAGTLTIDYAGFKYSQTGDNAWKSGESLVKNTASIFQVQVTNHNSTHTFYLGKDSAFVFYPTQGSSNTAFYVVKNNTTTNPLGISQYCPNSDYCMSIPPTKTVSLFFGASAANGAIIASTPSQVSIAQTPILFFGRLCNPNTQTCPQPGGSSYGQDTPFIAIKLS